MLRKATDAREHIDIKALRDNGPKAQELDRHARGREIHEQQLDDICYPRTGRRH